MIAESITSAVDTVSIIERQVSDDRSSQAALATIIFKVDKSTKKLLQNLKIMQQNLAAKTKCRDAEKEFRENVIMPMQVVEAPPTHTRAYHPIREHSTALTDAIWSPLGAVIVQGDHQITKAEKAGKISIRNLADNNMPRR